MIANLIDKQDNVEIIRDKIAQILADEVASQKALATLGAKDPLLWDLKIYIERSNPWETWLNNQAKTNKIPIVNVWFDKSNLDGIASNAVERQKNDGTFNIDIYGFGLSEDIDGGGHILGDENAALEVQRGLRLVRNILMAGEYTYLDLRGIVWRRWIQSIIAFQPEQVGNQAQQIQAIRIAFNVHYNEFSPQVEGQGIELITNEIKRQSDGSVIAQADYQYPIT